MCRFLLALGLVGCASPRLGPAPPEAAADATTFEGAARGFPVMRTLDGRRLGDGEFFQWLDEEDVLHVRITYEFEESRRIEEVATFRQRPRLLQERWLWSEHRNDRVVRQYRVDFATGDAVAERWEGDVAGRWSASLELEPGRTFAGVGFSLAVKRLRERLRKGEKIEILGVGFLPRPQLGKAEISYEGLNRLTMGGRTLTGERYLIRPKPPLLAKLFIDLPDSRLWLTHPPPAGFLRSEGPLAEPGDPVLRVDLLPGPDSP